MFCPSPGILWNGKVTLANEAWYSEFSLTDSCQVFPHELLVKLVRPGQRTAKLTRCVGRDKTAGRLLATDKSKHWTRQAGQGTKTQQHTKSACTKLYKCRFIFFHIVIMLWQWETWGLTMWASCSKISRLLVIVSVQAKSMQ